MKNLTKTFSIAAVIFILVGSLLESTKHVNAEVHIKAGKTIFRLTGR